MADEHDKLAEKRRKNLKLIQFSKEDDALIESDKPKETFADVGGLEDVKKKIRMNFILPLQQPELFAAYGKEAGGSLLLYGPPGCGKTFLARAVAGEIEANFMHIELQAILAMYVGQSENNLHNIFAKARENKPCVIFIDELDAMGGSRHQMRQHHDRMLVNQLLLELDGLQAENDQVFVIGATNTPWYLDSALRRPGRFNHLVFVPPPAEAERETILGLKLAGKPVEPLNLSRLAGETKFFSGADLEQVVSDAVETAMERTFETGEIQPITADDLRQAAKSRKATTLEWFATAKNYATFSDVNRDYQVVLDYAKKHGIK
ncbi:MULTISPECIES: ATP-binding protein [unclassified Paenibacillus]|uniref:ATP-binding protein n=1 Tax=unclassified Paenibacillus TaxID=185978 RepID=UPI002405F7CC|nr:MULTISPECIES: ATP-binding protein [unclassified Paenibacillus]MDF9844805.1 cell division protease FtsH [Paenibacillus sp. PastF-2]MDF9851394.1 cell division protease FtsH [Paenibacillus sp. PastM-2]MDF9857989.1 cell division protease FtsH [Paenibacillus sp. PastF-1]MDH6483257.1 cell division protease FtsH [Paenibacillus sp. PastH-2]MDH6510667.1 cell division protease FtsH [Paenibacillus sp. PastM-3]